MNNMTIPKRIKEYINNAGLKQRVVAEKSGYTEKQFSLMMTGKKVITAVDIERICLALGVSPLEFIKPEAQKAG